MPIALDYCYEFDLHEDEGYPTLETFREQMADRGSRGWEFAGSVTLDVGGPREVTVWRQLG